MSDSTEAHNGPHHLLRLLEKEVTRLEKAAAVPPGDAVELRAENERLRVALQQIDSCPVPDLPDYEGPADMSLSAKRYCAAFGACISIAHDALLGRTA